MVMAMACSGVISAVAPGNITQARVNTESVLRALANMLGHWAGCVRKAPVETAAGAVVTPVVQATQQLLPLKERKKPACTYHRPLSGDTDRSPTSALRHALKMTIGQAVTYLVTNGVPCSAWTLGQIERKKQLCHELEARMVACLKNHPDLVPDACRTQDTQGQIKLESAPASAPASAPTDALAGAPENS